MMATLTRLTDGASWRLRAGPVAKIASEAGLVASKTTEPKERGHER